MLILLAGGGFLSFNTGFAIWVLITMILFVFIMTRYAVPPIMNALEAREQKISESLKAAEEAIKRAEEISAKNDEALREAEAAAQKIRRDAVEQAASIRTERVEKAKAEADKMIEDARKAIEAEKRQAMQELRAEVSALAIMAAEKILGSEIDEKKNKKLVDDFVEGINKN